MQARTHKTAKEHACIGMALLLGLLLLAGCKKETAQNKAGDVSSPALSSPAPSTTQTPSEIPDAEAATTVPTAENSTALMSVHTIPSTPPPEDMPGMEPVSGLNMTVRMSPRMKNSPQWAGSFPVLFKAATVCMSQLEDGTAYIAGIRNHQDPIMHVIVVGHDGYWHDCPVDQSGRIDGKVTEIEAYDEPGPAFFPRDAGRPKTNNPQCTALEPVVALPGGLIGWLGFPIPDCTPVSPNATP